MAQIRFHLNGVLVEESAAEPDVTVLDYLRGARHLTGTKEGCAEGDCGACTVAIAGPDETYRAVNSCLLLLPQIDGQSLVSVEGVVGDAGGLHPVQLALVDTDGTQCGFCTPGFVMSLFAWHQARGHGKDREIHEALAGNLCRCTGYRPIVDACRHVAAIPTVSSPSIATGPSGSLDYTGTRSRFLAPTAIAELADILSVHPDARLIAGGTDLGLLFSRERKTLPLLVSIARIAELAGISDEPDAIVIGAAATYSATLPVIETHYPSFGALIRRIGSRQIRNLGTIAGNLANASPIGDTIPCLMALGASVLLRSRAGIRTLPVGEFITGYRQTALRPGEFIENIRIPKAPQVCFRAYKVSKRFDQDISAVVGAFALRIEDGQVLSLTAVYGGLAARAGEAVAMQSALRGREWRPESFGDVEDLLAHDFSPLSDHRASASYRRSVAANLVRRLCLESRGQSLPSLEEL